MWDPRYNPSDMISVLDLKYEPHQRHYTKKVWNQGGLLCSHFFHKMLTRSTYTLYVLLGMLTSGYSLPLASLLTWPALKLFLSFRRWIRLLSWVSHQSQALFKTFNGKLLPPLTTYHFLMTLMTMQSSFQFSKNEQYCMCGNPRKTSSWIRTRHVKLCMCFSMYCAVWLTSQASQMRLQSWILQSQQECSISYIIIEQEIVLFKLKTLCCNVYHNLVR